MIPELQLLHAIAVALRQFGALESFAHVLDAANAAIIIHQQHGHGTVVSNEWINKSINDYAVIHCGDRIW